MWSLKNPSVLAQSASIVARLLCLNAGSRLQHDGIAIQQRLAALPSHGLPLRSRALVHWDEHQIPFVEAESDEDLATVLGAIHVHLRWTQMEVMRRVSQGRLSEVIGPFGIEIDRALRVIGFGRPVAGIMRALPDETMRWLTAFLSGINYAIDRVPQPPPEFRILGLRRERWEIADILTIGRLIGFDVTWITWNALLRHRDQGFASALWRRLVGLNGAAKTSEDRRPITEVAKFASLVGRFGRPGSNSLAISPGRSATNGAWLASDTHLPVLLPNLWLVAGFRSPSYNAVGLMVPGLPALALGRNPWIAWGGTNLHAASSEIFDVSRLSSDAITARSEKLRVRWWRDRQIVIRECIQGPIISDHPLLCGRTKRTYALRWIGHEPSDEITALLRISRARNWREFRAALDLFALPGQNFVYADADGHIGKTMAAWLPRRKPAGDAGAVAMRGSPADWENIVTASDLPAILDPDAGFLVSANERPDHPPVPIGYFFSSRSRFDRLTELVRIKSSLCFSDLASLQRDDMVPAALDFRDHLLRLIKSRWAAQDPADELLRCLEQWDGRYAADSAGALAFELLVFHLAAALHGKKNLRLYSATWTPHDLICADLDNAAPDAVARALRAAIPATLRGIRRFRVWGRMHRLGLPHLFSAIPLVGRRFRFGDWPIGGGGETVMKTAHPLTDRRHFTPFAATARHISNLADPDGNYFVLLGGQDGWLGSTTLLDQAPLWQRGEYIKLPLRPETARATFPYHTELLP